MCVALAGLTSVLSFAVGAVQAVAGFSAQQQAADNQNAMYSANALAAQKAAVTSYANEQNAIIQKRNTADQSEAETSIAALQARGTARNSSGESGVTGLSVDALVNDYYGKEGRQLSATDQNYAMDSAYLHAQMDSTQAQTTQRINSVARAAQPNPLTAVLGVAGAAVGAMGNYTKMSGSTSTMSFET